MIQIKVSYDRPEQLPEVIKRLGDAVLSCRRATKQTGQHKRAYIILKG